MALLSLNYYCCSFLIAFGNIHIIASNSQSEKIVQRRATTVLYDDFSSGHIDSNKWKHQVEATGGGSHHFNWLTPEAENSYVKNNHLYLKPTLTTDKFGSNFLNHGTLNVTALYGYCSSSRADRCVSHGNGNIPPVMSSMLHSKASIRYGRVEVVAQMPRGDWLWPAIWMMPNESHYGGWPRSGEIDIMESRGNLHYHNHQGWQMGAGKESATIHYGPAWNVKKSHSGQDTLHGGTFADGFHTYWIDWTADYIKMGVDDNKMLDFKTPTHGYWNEGHFNGTNIWIHGGKDAPFDRPFYLIINVAVGGDYFNHNMINVPYVQPWHDGWDHAEQTRQFWHAKDLWYPTWHGEQAAMKVKSVKMIQY